MFQFYAKRKPFGRFMAIGVKVTVVSQIIALFYVICEFLNTLKTLSTEIDIA